MIQTRGSHSQTKEKILHASLVEFSENGLEGSTMRAIAQRAGTSLGLTYNYFKNKDEIVKELLINFFENREKVITESIQHLSDTELAIETHLRFLVEDIRKNEMMYRLHLSLLLQPKIMKRIKSNEHPFQELQERDKKLFALISKTAQQDLGIDGSVMMTFALGIITLSLANERSVDINLIPKLLIQSFKKTK
jgi:AcrR family transcriptional regulator